MSCQIEVLHRSIPHLSTPLIKAVQQASPDVISLLIKHGADTELAVEKEQTPLFYATRISAAKELLVHGANVNHQDVSGRTPLFCLSSAKAEEFLRHGANVNHEDRFGQTPLFCAENRAHAEELLRYGATVNHMCKLGDTALFEAIRRSRLDVVELLISNGADVNIYTRNDAWSLGKIRSITPLLQALRALFGSQVLIPGRPKRCQFAAERIENYFDIIKLIAPLSDTFSFTLPSGEIEPYIVYFFRAESMRGCDDLIGTKYMLRHGASANFSRFYDYVVACNFEMKPFTEAFLKLALLSGCSFDKYPCDLVEPVLKLVMNLFSQPLTLQELSIMAIRQCLSNRRLWTKIDSLSVPLLVKDKIKLKTYSETGRTNVEFKFRSAKHQVFINVCKSIL